MTNYDIDKISPRPWEVSGGTTIRPGTIFPAVLTISKEHREKDNEVDDLHHIVHCVNEHDELIKNRKRLEWLIFNGYCVCKGGHKGKTRYHCFNPDVEPGQPWVPLNGIRTFDTANEAIDHAMEKTIRHAQNLGGKEAALKLLKPKCKSCKDQWGKDPHDSIYSDTCPKCGMELMSREDLKKFKLEEK